MELSEILSLRPAARDSASICTAIERAETARAAELDRAGMLDAEAARLLLSATDAEIEQRERKAEAARRSADRLDVLIRELRGALERAEHEERADHTAELVAAAVRADAAFVAAWKKHLAPLAEVAAKIVSAKRAADDAIATAQRALGAEHGLGATPLPRAEWHMGEGPFSEVWLQHPRHDVLGLVAALAARAPSELAREQAERDAADARLAAKRARETADQAARVAVYREQLAREDADREAQRLARMTPANERAMVTISGQGW
jgi:hypothetical protein